MEHSKKIKTSSAIVIIILVLISGYFLLGKDRSLIDTNQSKPVGNQNPMRVVAESTPAVNGVLSVPKGFPQDIPMEKGGILESAISNYPDQNARQLSVSYISSKTVTQKYAEYKNYMVSSGYEIKEGGSVSSSVRAIFGTKSDVNFSVAISSSGGSTLVQLSYLLKSL